MALTSVFYDGPVTETDRATSRAGAPDYGVYGANDFKVSTHPSIPYAVNVAAGKAHGHGITDTAAETQLVQCASLSGTGAVRYDLIVVRRNWQPLLGGPSTLEAVQGGTAAAIPAERKVGPGVEDDQPLALIEWRGGVNTPYRIIDLRCFASTGGVAIVDILARGYLQKPGACVTLNQEQFQFLPGVNNVWSWVALSGTSGASANTVMRRDNDNTTAVGTMLLTAAQGTDSRAATRRDYVLQQVAAALSSAKSYALSVAGTARSNAEAYARTLTSDMRPAASGKRAIGTISAGGSAVNQTVSFPSGRFSAPPNVSVTGGSSRHSIGIQSINSTGFTFTCSNWSDNLANPDDIYWVAVQN